MTATDIAQVLLQSGALGLLALIFYFAARYIFPALKEFLTQLIVEQRRTNETLAAVQASMVADRTLAGERAATVASAVAQVREALAESDARHDRRSSPSLPSFGGLPLTR